MKKLQPLRAEEARYDPDFVKNIASGKHDRRLDAVSSYFANAFHANMKKIGTVKPAKVSWADMEEDYVAPTVASTTPEGVLQALQSNDTSNLVRKAWDDAYKQTHDHYYQLYNTALRDYVHSKNSISLSKLVWMLTTSVGRAYMHGVEHHFHEVVDNLKKPILDLTERILRAEDKKQNVSKMRTELESLRERNQPKIDAYTRIYRMYRGVAQLLQHRKQLTAHRYGQMMSIKSGPKPSLQDVITLNSLIKLTMKNIDQIFLKESFIEEMLQTTVDVLRVESVTMHKEDILIAAERQSLVNQAQNQLLKKYKLKPFKIMMKTQTATMDVHHKPAPGILFDEASGLYLKKVNMKESECVEGKHTFVKGKGCFEIVPASLALTAVEVPKIVTEMIDVGPTKYDVGQPTLYAATSGVIRVTRAARLPKKAGQREEELGEALLEVGQTVTQEELDTANFRVSIEFGTRVALLEKEASGKRTSAKRKKEIEAEIAHLRKEELESVGQGEVEMSLTAVDIKPEHIVPVQAQFITSGEELGETSASREIEEEQPVYSEEGMMEGDDDVFAQMAGVDLEEEDEE